MIKWKQLIKENRIQLTIDNIILTTSLKRRYVNNDLLNVYDNAFITKVIERILKDNHITSENGYDVDNIWKSIRPPGESYITSYQKTWKDLIDNLIKMLNDIHYDLDIPEISKIDERFHLVGEIKLIGPNEKELELIEKMHGGDDKLYQGLIKFKYPQWVKFYKTYNEKTMQRNFSLRSSDLEFVWVKLPTYTKYQMLSIELFKFSSIKKLKKEIRNLIKNLITEEIQKLNEIK